MKGFTCYSSGLAREDLYPNNQTRIRFGTSPAEYEAVYTGNSKFSQDKIFGPVGNDVGVFDGVLLNARELRTEYAVESNSDLHRAMFKSLGSRFVDRFNGNFNGLYYDAASGTIHFYSNFINSKPLFYWSGEQGVIVSSDLFEIVRILKQSGIIPSVSIEGIYMMLTYGYFLDEHTLFADIKRVLPGTVMSFDGAQISGMRYHHLDNEKHFDFAESRIIDELNEHLVEAARRTFAKDDEYGYRHLTLISGGLDSRMIGYFARAAGYEQLTQLNFGKMGSLDTSIAHQVSMDLNADYLFRDLGMGDYIADVSGPVRANSGSVFHLGSAHAYATLNLIDWDQFGLLHNGNLADIIHGDYLSKPYHTQTAVGEWGTSNRLIEKIRPVAESIIQRYPNLELFALYNRGAHAILNGDYMAFEHSETAQLYLDRDAVEYAMRIPPKLKYKERNFIKLINRYYPEAAQYKWEKWVMRPTNFNAYLFQNPIYGFGLRGWKYLKRHILPEKSTSSMNPFRYWQKNNRTLANRLHDRLDNGIERIENLELREDMVNLFSDGNLFEQSLVLTVLESLNQCEVRV
jgi:asparagine synthase (glutamine-hydrolysing)